MALPSSDTHWNFLAEINRGGRLSIFLVSLLVASAVWLLNTLNKTYVESVEIGLKYVNLPEHFAFYPVPPSRLKLEISSDGFNLFQLIRQSQNDTLEIDLQSMEFTTSGSRSRGVIPTDVLLSSVRNKFGSGVMISHLGMDSIPINLEIGKTVEVRVQPDFEISLENGFTLNGPVQCRAITIKVSGPQSLVDTLTSIPAEPIIAHNLKETLNREVRLLVDKRVFQLSQETVNVIAEVERLTEGEIEVPIQVLGLPDNRTVRLIPEVIRVKYFVGLSNFERIQPQLFGAVVQYSDVMQKPSKLQITLETVPTFVQVVQFYPERVDYLVLEKVD